MEGWIPDPNATEKKKEFAGDISI